MSSISDQLRENLSMTYAEQEQLIASGWPAVVIVALRRRGFREVSPVMNGDGSTTPAFLRQTEFPHIHLALDKSAPLEDLDTAIHDAAYRLGYQSLADLWHRFTDSVKSWHRPHRTDLAACLVKRESAVKANDQTQQPHRA